jgi:hypothetical protein
MRTATWVVIVALLAAPSLQALEPHPMKVWLLTNQAERKSVDEKKAVSQARKKAWIGGITAGLAAGTLAALRHQDVGSAIVAGAIAGAVAGYAIGKMEDKRIADRGTLEQRVAYDPSQGYRAEVTRIACDPCRVKPGQKFNLTISYWAMGPQRAPLAFSRHLGLSVGGSYIRVFTFDPDPFTMEEGGGEFETTLEYTIPKEGTYTMDWLVENDQASIQQAGSTDIVVSNAG